MASRQNADGSFGASVRWRDSQAAVAALDGEGSIDASALASWTENIPTSNNDYLARKITLRSALASTVETQVAELLGAQQPDGGFGLSAEYPSDAWDTALALEALCGVDEAATERDRAATFLAAAQNADGGWELIEGAGSDVFMTCEVVRVLALHAQVAPASVGEPSAISRGGAWLGARLAEDGSAGGSVADTARVFSALVDAQTAFDRSSTLAWIVAQQSENGAFGAGGTYETALGLSALRRAQVNVAVTDVRVSDDNPRAGEVVRVTATVANTGRNRSSGLSVRFGDGSPSAQFAEVSDLAPGESGDVAFNYRVRETTGTVTLSATVDPAETLFETDEADNAMSESIVVRGPLEGPVPLLPTGGSLSSTARPSFAWAAPLGGAEGALGYILQFDRASTFDSPALRSETVTATPSALVSFETPSGVSLAEGAWYWRVRAFDGATISEWSQPQDLIVDTVAPRVSGVAVSTTLFSPNGDGVRDDCGLSFELSEDASLTVSVLDASSNDLGAIETSDTVTRGHVNANWDGSLAVADGTYRLRIAVRDGAGNTSTIDSLAVAIDRTAPTLSNLASTIPSISPNADGFFDTTTLSWSAQGASATIVRIIDPRGKTIRIDEVTTQSFIWNGRNAFNAVAEEGDYTVSVSLRDTAGNTSAPSEETITLKTRCSVGRPVITPQVARPGERVTVRVPTHDDSNLAMTIGGPPNPMVDTGDGFRSLEITAPVAVGNHTVTIEARDSLKNLTRMSDSALIVRRTEVTGASLVINTQQEFRSDSYTGQSTLATTTLDAVPGSVQLSRGGWSNLGDMPNPRYASFNALGPDGRMFVIGGWWENSWPGYHMHSVLNTSIYNPDTGRWTEGAPIPKARRNGRAVFAPNGKIYCIGGNEIEGPWYESRQITSNMVEAYDPATNTWERDTNNGGTLAPMPTARCVFGAALGPDGKIYCVGGYTGTLWDGGSTSVVEVYDPVTNTWETRAPLPQPTCCFATTDRDGSVYVLEGEYRRNGGTNPGATNLNNTWRYNTIEDTWTAGTPSPVSRTDAISAPGRDGRLWVFGGSMPWGASSYNFGYDPIADDWIRGEDLPNSLEEQAGISDAQGRPYLFGGSRYVGYGGTLTYSDIYRFDPYYASSGVYVSPPKEVGSDSVAFGAITWDGVVPEGTSATFATRTSYDGVNWSEWSEEYVTSGSSVTSPNGGYVQFRIRMESTDPLKTPRIDKVSIVYNRCPTVKNPYQRTFATRTPLLQWQPAYDYELDPVAYDIQLDTSPTFNTPELRQFADVIPSFSYATAQCTVPPKAALPDGTYYMRVRASDGFTRSKWSAAVQQTVDATPPQVTLPDLDPPAISVADYGTVSSSFPYSVDEACSVRILIWRKNGTTWQVARTVELSNVVAGDRSFAWDGLTDSGARSVPGEYRLDLSATDPLKNTSVKYSTYFQVRTAAVSTKAWPMSDVFDPQAATSLDWPISGNATHVVARAEGESRTLLDADGDGTFTGAIARNDTARRVMVEGIESVDAATGHRVAAPDARLDTPGDFGASAWVDRDSADFAGGVSDNVSVEPRGITLPKNAWFDTGARIPAGVYDAARVRVGSKLYIFGGNPIATVGNKAQVIDLVSGQSSTLPDMPTARVSAAAALGGDGRIYVIGGTGSGWAAMAVEAYDPSSNTWEKLPMLSAVFSDGSAFTAEDGRIFLVGGSTSSSVPSMRVFNPTTRVWTQKTSMPDATTTFAGCYLAGKYYVFGGVTRHGATSALKVYDVGTDTWVWGPSLPAQWYGQCAEAVDGKIYIFGRNMRWFTNSTDSQGRVYDPRTGAYTPFEHPGVHAYDAASAAYQGSLYSVGGTYTKNGQNVDSNVVEAFRLTRSGTYTSSTYDAGGQVDWGRIGWSAYLPAETSLTVQTRSSLNTTSWSEWSAPYSTGDLVSSPAGRYLQYRLVFGSSAFEWLPTLGDIAVGVERSEAPPISAPIPIAPSDETAFDGSPTLQWANSIGGLSRSYEVQLDTSPTFDSPARRELRGIGELPQKSVAYIPASEPLSDGGWYWRARAIDGINTSPWSVATAFEVASLPALTLQRIDAPSAVIEGAEVTATVVVSNAGAPAQDVVVRLAEGDQTDVRDRTIASLGHDETATVTFSVDTLGKAGELRLAAIVDPEADLAEADRGDNAADAAVVVTPHGMSVSASTSQPSYVATDTVAVSAAVRNDSLASRDASVELGIVDADDALVADLGSRDAGSVDASGSASVEATWSAAEAYPGQYQVRAVLVSGGRRLAESRDAFTIRPDIALRARLSVGRLEYGAGEPVQVTSRVLNESANALFDGLIVRTRVLDASGAQRASQEAMATQLQRGESRMYGLAWDAVGAEPGTYRAIEEVVLDGSTVASSSASFEIAPTSATGDGVTGSVEASPGAVYQGESASIELRLANDGNTDIAMPVHVSVIDPQSTSTVLWTRTIQTAVAEGASAQESLTLDTGDLPILSGISAKHLLVVARAELPDGGFTLGHTVLRVTPLRVSAGVSTSANEYDCGSSLEMTASVSNDTTGYAIPDVATHLTVAGPNGDEVFAETRVVDSVEALGTHTEVFERPLGTLPPGEYSARVDVTVAGRHYASAETTFTILSTAHTGTGLVGQIASQVTTLEAGEPLTVDYGVRNDGNADVDAMPIAIVVADAATGDPVAEATTTASLARGADVTGTATFDTTAFVAEEATVGRAVLVHLKALAPAGARQLAQVGVYVEPAPRIEADIEMRVGSRARVLAWCEDAGDRGMVTRSLGGAAAYLDFAATSDEFVGKMRSGLFDTYVVLDATQPLTAHVDSELAERVNSGATLIGSCWADVNDSSDKDVFGVLFRGTLPDGPREVPVAETVRTPAVTAHTGGKALKLTLNGATQLAQYADTPSGASAITVNRYGRGTAMLFGFDLGTVERLAAEALLRKAVFGTPADERSTDCGDVVSAGITVRNTGLPTTFRVKTTVADGKIVAAPSAIDGIWTLQLDSDETTTLACLIRLPDAPGRVALTVGVEGDDEGEWIDCGVSTLEFEALLGEDGLIDDALARIGSVSAESGAEKTCAKRITSALQDVRTSPPAIGQDLAFAVQKLAALADDWKGLGAKAADARFATDEVLRFYEARMGSGDEGGSR